MWDDDRTPTTPREITDLREADTILRWIEAGFPPWGCDACRGAEYGPDGRACVSCGGRSDLIEPPERAAKIRDAFEYTDSVANAYVEATRRVVDLLVRLRPWSEHGEEVRTLCAEVTLLLARIPDPVVPPHVAAVEPR